MTKESPEMFRFYERTCWPINGPRRPLVANTEKWRLSWADKKIKYLAVIIHFKKIVGSWLELFEQAWVA